MAGNWTVSADTTEIEQEEWARQEEPNAGVEDDAWTLNSRVLTHDVQDKKNSLLGFGGWAASEFAFFPDEVEVFPEETQADHLEWTIRPEAD